MRKRIIAPTSGESSRPAASWLDVERHVEVELTSEDPDYPIESALRPGGGAGWRAAEPGMQTIRLRFDTPRRFERVRLVFEERDEARTQEFVLRWSGDEGRSYREIVRQQYTFSPPGTGREVEDYAVHLDGVTALELRIVPEIGGGESRASLAEWLLA
ncbi:MAG TPA: hypothetical protein VNA89_14420 [Gemmatimonadaceae bacterium]|nr:hypothetical protein [Gemmatimonadaceae bacterium]